MSTKIAGILNITPDSFADGGKYSTPVQALKQVSEMIASGIDMIDIGAESTRPGGTKITQKEESRRLEPIIPMLYKLARENGILVSLDSRNYKTLKEFKNCYDIINDVTGLSDPQILEFQRKTGKEAIFMHSITVPVNRKKFLPEDADPIKYIQDWLDKKIEHFKANKLDLTKLIFDPGIGFGLRPMSNLAIIKRLREFNLHGLRMMIGHSRKSFLRVFGEVHPSNRDPETHVLSAYLMNSGVDFIRVHDFESTIRIKKLVQELYS